MIIGLSGLAGSGKSFVAQCLVTAHKFKEIALAQPMKEFCREIFDFSDEQLYGPSEYRNAPDMRYKRADGTYLTPREALQTLGTNWARSCWEDTWIELGWRRAVNMQSAIANPYYSTGVVISDVRFKNEIEGLSRRGCKLWRIKRPGIEGLAGPAGTHPSETEQMSVPDTMFDRIIVNDGDKLDLMNKVKELLK